MFLSHNIWLIFMAPSWKSHRSPTARTNRAAEGREIRRWYLHFSSARGTMMQWKPLTSLVLQVLQVYGMDNTVVESILSSFKRCQQVASSIFVHSVKGMLSSSKLPSSLPAPCWGHTEAEQIDTWETQNMKLSEPVFIICFQLFKWSIFVKRKIGVLLTENGAVWNKKTQ